MEPDTYAVADRILKDLLVVALGGNTRVEDVRAALCGHLERFKEKCVIRSLEEVRPEPKPLPKTLPSPRSRPWGRCKTCKRVPWLSARH